MTFTVRALGSAITVDLDDSLPAPVRERITEQWAHLRISGASDGTRTVRVSMVGAPARGGADQTVAVSDPIEAPDALASALTLVGLRDLVGEHFLFHAAGLATPDGSVIALVGPSGRGKTTASRELGRSLRYVTDETVAIRPDGSILPYPKPLSVGTRPGTKTLYAPQEVGLTVAVEPLRLGALVLLDRGTTGTGVQVDTIDLIDALAELVSQTSSLALIPRPLSSLAALVDRTGGVRRMRYTEAADLPPAVDEVLAEDSVSRGSLTAVQTLDRADAAPGGIRRAEFAEAVTDGERIAVLSRYRFHILDGVGAALWQAADGLPLTELKAAVIAGMPPAPAGVDVDSLLEDAVVHLRDAGLIEDVPTEDEAGSAR